MAGPTQDHGPIDRDLFLDVALSREPRKRTATVARRNLFVHFSGAETSTLEVQHPV
jgi:hypothetical protein